MTYRISQWPSGGASLEPCLCGADDCRLCRPGGYREVEYDEDDRRDYDREDRDEHNPE